MRDLGTLGGRASRAFDINPFGVIVGFAQNANGRERAVRWVNGVIQSLGTLGGADQRGHRHQRRRAHRRPEPGQVGRVPGLHLARRCHDRPGGLGGGFTQANAINAKGQITGYGEDPAGVVHAILWSGGDNHRPRGAAQRPAELRPGHRRRGTGGALQRSPAGRRRATDLPLEERQAAQSRVPHRPAEPHQGSPAGDLVGSSTDASGTQVATLWRRR